MAHQKTKSDEFDFDNIYMDSSVLGDQTMASLENKPQLPAAYVDNTKPSAFHHVYDTEYSTGIGNRPTDMAYVAHGDDDDISTLAMETSSERPSIRNLFPSISIKNKEGVCETPERGNTTKGRGQGSDTEHSNSNEDDTPKGDTPEQPSFRQLKYFIAAGFAIFLIGSIIALLLGLQNLKALREPRGSSSLDENRLDGWDWTFRPTSASTSPPTVSASPSFTPTTASPSSTPTTSAPTSSMMPTPKDPISPPPTSTSTRRPTSTPTQMPSGKPSVVSSLSPTSLPTVIPSSLPSVAPTTPAPTPLPSSLPTPVPTSTPTKAATNAPSSLPSPIPTMTPTTSPPTQLPSSSPTMTKEETFRTFVGGAEPKVLEDILQPGSVQKEVYDWLIADPDFYSYSEDRLVQRYALGVFSLKTSENRRRLSLEYSDECDWFPPIDGSAACDDQGIRENIVMRDLRLDGTLPTELYMLEKLKTLVMSNNGLIGMLSDDIKGMKSLRVLDLSGNLLVGSVPGKIGDIKKLRILDLSNNSFTGVFPNVGKLKDAKQVNLSSNLISGTIPADIRKMKNVESLDLRTNRLTGTIPLEMMQMVKLQQLHLANNLLTGVVNATFCEPLVNLAVFTTDCLEGGPITCNCCTNCASSIQSTNFDKVVAQSSMIEITEVSPPNLRGATNPSSTSACENKVDVTKTCFESGSDIRVHFTNCDAKDDDWIGLYNSNVDLQELGEPFLWLEACGSQDCGVAKGHGSVYFDETAAAGSSWPLAIGSYKAVLVSKAPNGESYQSFAQSGEIQVQDSC